jgi:hypothetical protein
MTKSKNLRQIIGFAASPAFFWVVLGLFMLESLWIALTAVYPMAFDEDFHFGLIKLYSHHLLPFLAHQPAGANIYGAVVNNPSYLYHYLLSFPYRLIELFTRDQTLQVIWLRLINVALFSYSLVLFRQVLLRAKIGAALTNMAILLFALIPIVPMLAGEINYDNLTMVLVAWSCLLVEEIIFEVRAKKIPLRLIILLFCIGLLGSIVKYAFLPVLAASVLIVVILLLHYFRNNFKDMRKAAAKDLSLLNRYTLAGLTLLFVLSVGLFSQRYLVNIAAYKTPIPRCELVLTVDDCMSYGPFNRTYTLEQTKDPNFKANVLAYLPQWFYGMWYRTFFSVNGNVATPDWARYETIPPLKLPSLAAVSLLITSLALIVVYLRKLYRDELIIFLALVIVLYTAALFIDNYGSYARSGQPLAVNGRYLLPMVLPFAVIAARAWQLALAGHSLRLKMFIAGLIIVLFIQGGGSLTFIVESNYTWYWPDHRVQTASFYAREIARHFVVFSNPVYILPP